MPEGLLSGYKVLDLTHFVAGPYCARLMAALGSEVIKVERPGAGDPARRIGPFAGGAPHPERSVLFLYLNAAKQSITLDLQSATGRRILKELVRWADVVVEGFRPGVLDRLGLGYEALATLNPRLVMTSVSSYGQTGPYRDLKGYELNLYAAGGLLYITGEADQPPLQEGARLSQYGAGQNAFVATLTALWHREETSEGQHVDLAVTEYNTSVLENVITMHTYAGHIYQRTGNRGFGRAAWGIYPCRDGFVSVIAGPDHRWPAMAQLMGIPELLDPRFGGRRGRSDCADEIDALMLPWLLERDKVETFQAAQRLGLAFAYVATPEDILRSEQLRDRGYWVALEHPEAGLLEYPGAPFRPSEGQWTYGRAPLLGEHNEVVYCGLLGYSREDLVRLREAGVM